MPPGLEAAIPLMRQCEAVPVVHVELPTGRELGYLDTFIKFVHPTREGLSWYVPSAVHYILIEKQA